MSLDLDTLKSQVNQTLDVDDTLLTRLLSVATAHVERLLGFAIDDSDQFADGTPADLAHAVYMLAAHLYENRETALVGVQAMELPYGVQDIVRNYRTWSWSDDV